MLLEVGLKSVEILLCLFWRMVLWVAMDFTPQITNLFMFWGNVKGIWGIQIVVNVLKMLFKELKLNVEAQFQANFISTDAL